MNQLVPVSTISTPPQVPRAAAHLSWDGLRLTGVVTLSEVIRPRRPRYDEPEGIMARIEGSTPVDAGRVVYIANAKAQTPAEAMKLAEIFLERAWNECPWSLLVLMDEAVGQLEMRRSISRWLDIKAATAPPRGLARLYTLRLTDDGQLPEGGRDHRVYYLALLRSLVLDILLEAREPNAVPRWGVADDDKLVTTRLREALEGVPDQIDEDLKGVPALARSLGLSVAAAIDKVPAWLEPDKPGWNPDHAAWQQAYDAMPKVR